MTLTEKTEHAVGRSVAVTAPGLASLAAVLGMLEAWIGRNEMNSDGVSYLDVADAFARGDWEHFINGYWSPLYPALIGSGLKVLHPSAAWQFPVAHLVNFVIYLLAIAAFHYFLGGVVQFEQWGSEDEPGTVRLSKFAWLVLGYALFIWTSLRLITVAVVSPDMAVAACVYFAAGALIRIRLCPDQLSNYALLGVALGLGCLAKAPMLPLAAVFLGVCALGVWKARTRLPGLVIAAISLVIVAGPFAMALSRSEHRPTFGDSATLNYVWYVNHIPRYHWNGQFAGMGAAAHPTTLLFQNPPIYGFNGYGTYAIWENPAQWYEGIKPHFALRSIANQVAIHAQFYFELFFKLQSVLIVCLGGLVLLAGKRMIAWSNLARWPLWAVAVAPFCMYALVHVETRMIGAFVALLWIGCFSAVSLARSGWSERVILSFVTATAGFLLVTVIASTLGQLATNPGSLLRVEASSGAAGGVARSLQNLGVHRGDAVAWIRPDRFDEKQNYWWARLAGVKIVAEVPSGKSDAFWAATAEARSRAIQAIAPTGARVLIATSVPLTASLPEWRPLGNTGYYALPLHGNANASPTALH